MTVLNRIEESHPYLHHDVIFTDDEAVSLRRLCAQTDLRSRGQCLAWIEAAHTASWHQKFAHMRAFLGVLSSAENAPFSLDDFPGLDTIPDALERLGVLEPQAPASDFPDDHLAVLLEVLETLAHDRRRRVCRGAFTSLSSLLYFHPDQTWPVMTRLARSRSRSVAREAVQGIRTWFGISEPAEYLARVFAAANAGDAEMVAVLQALRDAWGLVKSDE